VVDADAERFLREHMVQRCPVVHIGEIELVCELDADGELDQLLANRGLCKEWIVMTRDQHGDRRCQ
jgi:hypothetical protein